VLDAEPKKGEARGRKSDEPKKPEPPAPPAAPKGVTVQAVPAAPRTPNVAFAAPAQQEKMKEAMEKGEQKFKEAIDRVKDNPEAREAMEKAMKEFHRAMEESMKTAPRFAQPGQQFQGVQGFQGFQPKKGFEGGNFQFAPAGDARFVYQVGGKGGDGRLGVAVEKPNEVLVEQLNLPKGQGVIVVQVTKDSPAEKAGIKAKDVLLTVGSKSVPSEPGDAVKLIIGLKADEIVDVVVIRKGEKQTIKGIALPEVKKVELRRLDAKPDGKGGIDFNLKDANNPDDLKKEIEKQIREAHEQARKAHDEARREVERVQRDLQKELPKIQNEARREVERAMKELPKIQGDLQKEIERMKAELRRMEAELEKGGKGGTSGGKGEGPKGKSSSSSMSVTTDGETFTITADRDGVKYQIAGTLEDGKAVAGKVTVKDGDKEFAGSADKVPAKYRDEVKKMLGSVGGGKK
jgi:hypothetical protein